MSTASVSGRLRAERQASMPADYWTSEAVKARKAAAAKRRKEYLAETRRVWEEYCRSIGRIDLVPTKGDSDDR